MSHNMGEPTRQGPELPTAAAKAEEDRHCPECGVKLSSYNPGPNCWSHTVGWPWRGPSAKPRF
jgi:hypothetical protein